MQFRDYQKAAIESVYEFFVNDSQGNPVIAMPPGTGKSVVIAGFVQSFITRYPQGRIMMLTHVKELIEQNFEKLIGLWPAAPAGIYSASVGRRDVGFPITFAGIASVAKKAAAFGHVDLVIVDECHLVSSHGTSMYRHFIDKLRERNSWLRVIGLSATPYRLGMGLLTENGLFSGVCFDNTRLDQFNELIRECFLAPLLPKRTDTEINVEGIGTVAGEFNQRELEAIVDQEEITREALTELMDINTTCRRKHGLIFGAGVIHCEHIAKMLRDRFHAAAYAVHSKMSLGERSKLIADFKAGKIQFLVNNNLLTTGFDFPDIDLIGVLRPTKSPALWVQMLGRGIRPVYHQRFTHAMLGTREGRWAAMCEGPKQNCIVLDFAANTSRIGPINDPKIPGKPKKGGAGVGAPVRVCENCKCYNHISAVACEFCGAEFTQTVNIERTASTVELVRGAPDIPQVIEIAVDRIEFRESKHGGKVPTLRASYQCGIRRFSEWKCFNHPPNSYAHMMAREWWQKRCAIPGTAKQWPENVTEALERTHEIKVPRAIRVWLNKRRDDGGYVD